MDPQDKSTLKWKYSFHKHRLNDLEQAVFILAINDFTVGKIAKAVRIEAPVVLHMLKDISQKLW